MRGGALLAAAMLVLGGVAPGAALAEGWSGSVTFFHHSDEPMGSSGTTVRRASHWTVEGSHDVLPRDRGDTWIHRASWAEFSVFESVSVRPCPGFGAVVTTESGSGGGASDGESAGRLEVTLDRVARTYVLEIGASASYPVRRTTVDCDGSVSTTTGAREPLGFTVEPQHLEDDFSPASRRLVGSASRQLSFGMETVSWNLTLLPDDPYDIWPPNTRIIAGPTRVTEKRRATFRLRSTEPGSRFRCRLDRRLVRPCRSPWTYRNLSYGRHTFSVSALDAAGNLDPTPAVYRWRVNRPVD